MPQIVPNIGRDNRIATKILAAVVVVVYLIFAFTMIILGMTFLPQMEEASEETSRMIGGSDGGAVSIVQDEVIPEIRLVYVLSLIIFGLLDGVFAFILWSGKPPYSHDNILLPLAIILAVMYFLNRAFSTYVMTQLSIMTLVGSNSRALMNMLYLTIPIFSAVSLVIILIVKKKVFSKKRAHKVVFKIPEDAAL